MITSPIIKFEFWLPAIILADKENHLLMSNIILCSSAIFNLSD